MIYLFCVFWGGGKGVVEKVYILVGEHLLRRTLIISLWGWAPHSKGRINPSMGA